MSHPVLAPLGPPCHLPFAMAKFTLLNTGAIPWVIPGSPKVVFGLHCLPNLFIQLVFFSLPGSKVTSLCPSLLWPSVLSSSFQRWGEQGTVMGSDLARRTWCWSWVSGPCFCCHLAALRPLAMGLGQCFHTQSFPRLPCLCGTKSCGLVSIPSMNWGNETRRGALGRRGMLCRLALFHPVRRAVSSAVRCPC